MQEVCFRNRSEADIAQSVGVSRFTGHLGKRCLASSQSAMDSLRTPLDNSLHTALAVAYTTAVIVISSVAAQMHEVYDRLPLPVAHAALAR
jgi:hypothetical protein